MHQPFSEIRDMTVAELYAAVSYCDHVKAELDKHAQ